MIKQFALYFKINFSKETQYRSAAISGIITQLFFGFMYILIYQAFYSSNYVPSGFSLSQMVTYIWLQQAFFTLFKYYDANKDISKQIVNGDISYQLIKPINLYNQWFFNFYTTNISKVVSRSAIFLLVAALLPFGYGISLPASWTYFGLFVLSFVIGSFLIVAINMFSYILVTITLSPMAVFGFMVNIAGLFCGQVIPLPLLPKWFQTFTNFLPFRYANDLTFRLYIGNISITEGFKQIGIQLGWLIGLIILGKIALKKRSKKFVVQGG